MFIKNILVFFLLHYVSILNSSPSINLLWEVTRSLSLFYISFFVAFHNNHSISQNCSNHNHFYVTFLILFLFISLLKIPHHLAVDSITIPPCSWILRHKSSLAHRLGPRRLLKINEGDCNYRKIGRLHNGTWWPERFTTRNESERWHRLTEAARHRKKNTQRSVKADTELCICWRCF